jgi:hypothetical protein
MSINIPFNFDPVSVSIKTGAYNVPANNYARITVLDKNFTIDGTLVSTTSDFSGSGATGGLSIIPKTALYTNGESVDARVLVYVAGDPWTSNSFYSEINGQTVSGAPVNGFIDVPVGATLFFNGNHSGVGEGTWHWVGNFPYHESQQTEFWLPAGTALNGDRYLVTLYTKIS